MRSSLPTSHWFEPVPRPGVKPTPNPLPPSTKSNFVQQFEFTGTVDNAALLCIPAALKFREEVCGGEDASKFARAPSVFICRPMSFNLFLCLFLLCNPKKKKEKRVIEVS